MLSGHLLFFVLRLLAVFAHLLALRYFLQFCPVVWHLSSVTSLANLGACCVPYPWQTATCSERFRVQSIITKLVMSQHHACATKRQTYSNRISETGSAAVCHFDARRIYHLLVWLPTSLSSFLPEVYAMELVYAQHYTILYPSINHTILLTHTHTPPHTHTHTHTPHTSTCTSLITILSVSQRPSLLPQLKPNPWLLPCDCHWHFSQARGQCSNDTRDPCCVPQKVGSIPAAARRMGLMTPWEAPRLDMENPFYMGI